MQLFFELRKYSQIERPLKKTYPVGYTASSAAIWGRVLEDTLPAAKRIDRCIQ